MSSVPEPNVIVLLVPLDQVSPSSLLNDILPSSCETTQLPLPSEVTERASPWGSTLFNLVKFAPLSTLRAASLLLTAGAKGKRRALPNATVMIHQVLGGFQGQNADIQIHAQETLRVSSVVNDVLARHTGQPIDVIEKDTDRDNFMTAEQAIEYGLIDEIVTERD